MRIPIRFHIVIYESVIHYIDNFTLAEHNTKTRNNQQFTFFVYIDLIERIRY